MKTSTLLLFSLVAILHSANAQPITASQLMGTWDQAGKSSHVPSMIFVDTAKVKFSYKGHSGTSKSYYYIIKNSNVPTILTVDYKANHRKHRNEYLIQLVANDTMKLQVLHKKDARDHFNEDNPNKIYTLVRRN
ncbi:MAG TPA: hypothetical protein VKR32_09470 [Puia sp.]|nr:hypothetical protein [Puia sp.]